MSEIKSDTGTTRQDALRRQQEAFDKREGDVERKHRDEMHGLKEHAREDQQALAEAYEDRLNKERAQNRDRITDQDVKHQKEIAELRALHQKQLEREARTAAAHEAAAKTAKKSKDD